MAVKVYAIQETEILFAPAASVYPDITFEIDGVATAAGHQSAQKDLGIRTTASSRIFMWRAFIQLQATTPVVGNVIDIYLKTAYSSNVNHIDNNDGVLDGAVSSINKLKNLKFIGSIVVDDIAANIPMSSSGTVEINEQFVQVVFWNASGASVSTDVDTSGFILAAMPDEVQTV